MADSVITINAQKFRKVKGVWVDQTKTPAPKDLIALLDKLSAAEAAAAGPGEAKESKPALPVLPIAAKDFSTAKLESSINRLAIVVEKLSKTIQKSESKKQSSKDQSAKQDTDDTDVPASPAQKISEPGKIPTLREAMKLNTKDFFKGTTDKYGEKDKPGLLRTIGEKSFPVIGPAIFAARDRQRAAAANQLKELENPKAVPVKPEPATRVTKETAKEVAQMKAANPELTSSKALEQIRARSAAKQEAVNTNKIPTFREALKLNTKDFFKGTTNKYGEKENPGLLRTIGEKSFPVIGPAIFAARDRQRAAAANQLKESGPTSGASGEKEREKTMVQGKSEFASPDLGTKIVAVKITEIDDSVLKKLKEIFGKKDDKDSSDDKEENKSESDDDEGDSFFDKMRKRVFGGGTKRRGRRGRGGRGRGARGAPARRGAAPRAPAGAVDATGKKIGGQFVKAAAAEGVENVAEQAAKKPGVLSRIAGGAKYAKTGIGSLLKGGGLRGVLGLAGGAALSGVGLALTPSDLNAGEDDLVKKQNAGSPQQMRLQAEAEAAASNKVPAAKKPNVLSKLFGGGAKAAEKAGAKAGAKTGAKVLGKGLFKSALKKIPGVGLVAGGVFAASRALKGDFVGAGLELASGAAGTIPGVGTAASIGIDAALAAKDMGAFGGAPPGSPAEAAQGAPAVPVKPKTPSKFASVAKALGKGALMATPFGAAALGAKAIGGLLKNNKNTAEMAKPTGVTEQTQALTATTKQVEAAKQQKPAAGPTVINNNVSSPTNVSSSQGVIGGPTVADRGSLNLASF